MTEKFHSPDCSNAHTPRCRCWCKGEFHGLTTGVYAVIDGKQSKPVDMINGEKVLTTNDGGDIEKQIRELLGKQFTCVGMCNKPLPADAVWGYPHDGGEADANGVKYWMYVKCHRCHYATSLWKIKKHLINEVPAV